MKHHAAGDLQRGHERHRIGRRPAGGVHGAHEVGFRALEADVDHVAGDALGGDGAGAEVGEAALALVVAPRVGRDEIGREKIDRHDRHDDGERAASVELRQPHRRDFGPGFA